ncbi:MAG: Na+/H+ antiporter NhaA [Flavobacteriales bacterium]|nr:Na+/H+ antiporter NhaA [Flavobacteriales bacterium]
MKKTPIDSLIVIPVSKLIHSSFASGIILFISVIAALVIANSPWSFSFNEIWEYDFSIKLGSHEVSKSLHHWINDGLMAIFFFVIGLELKREIMNGELSNPKNAIMPIAAGIGGMIVPALIFIAFNHSGEASNGWGIPMATDIAFALGVLHFLGNKIPLSLKIFLTVLAIADDIGAVLVIAFFYTSEISMYSLGIASLFLSIMFIANYLGVRSLLFYSIVGMGGFWLSFSNTGIHTTISGVLAAFAIPGDVKIDSSSFVTKMKELLSKFNLNSSEKSSTLVSNDQLQLAQKMKIHVDAAITPLQRMENMLHPIVAFIILPLFALANSGVTFDNHILSDLLSPITYGIILGLVFGKVVGVTIMVKLVRFLNLAKMPQDINWRHIIGVGFIAGIGFTMSLFVASLALTNEGYISQAKTGILFASILSGLIGFIILKQPSKNASI